MLIKKDELFGCIVSATSFLVPVFHGHIASIRIQTSDAIDACLLPESSVLDPRILENNHHVAIGGVRIQKNTAGLVVCCDHLTSGAAIPAVALILGS
jgi:aspartate-semialdehyde dehydrogenase